MNREQAQLILDHLDIVKHFASGGMLEHVSSNWRGATSKATPVLKGLIINCLPHYRTVNRQVEPKPQRKYSRWCPNRHISETELSEQLTGPITIEQTKRTFKETIKLAESLGFTWVYTYVNNPTWTPIEKALQENWWKQISTEVTWILEPYGHCAMLLKNISGKSEKDTTPRMIHLTSMPQIIQ